MRKTLYLYSLLAGILSLSCSYRAYASVAVSYGGETTNISSAGTNFVDTQWDYVYNVSWGVFPEKPSQWGISSMGGTVVGATTADSNGGSWSGQYYSTVAAYNAAVVTPSGNIQALFGNGYGAVVWVLAGGANAEGSVNGGFHYTSIVSPGAVNTMSGNPSGGSGVTAPTWVSNSDSTTHATTGTIYTSTPEPSSFWMLTLALSGFGLRKLRRRKRHEPRT